MEKKNNNGLLVGLLLGLVIAALVVGGLYVTGNINFKKTITNNEQVSENNNTKEKNAIKNNENNEINKSTDGVEKQGSVNDNVNEVTFNNEKISVLDLTQEIIHISSGGVQSINPNYDYYIDLKLSGKVKIRTLGMSSQNSDESYEDFISNVSNVIDIIEFPVPAEPNEQIIYIFLQSVMYPIRHRSRMISHHRKSWAYSRFRRCGP